MVRVIGTLKLHDVVLLIRELWRERLACTECRQRFRSVAAPETPADGLTVLALGSLYPAQLGGMSLEVALRGYTAHPYATPCRNPGGGRRRHGRHGYDALDFIACSSWRLRLALGVVVLPIGVLFGSDEFSVDLVHVHHLVVLLCPARTGKCGVVDFRSTYRCLVELRREKVNNGFVLYYNSEVGTN